MCGIVDANVAHEVFGDERPPAGERFFNWLASPRGQLVVGGELLRELDRNHGFTRWLGKAIGYDRARRMADEDIEAHTDALRRSEVCKSDDEHVLALAVASGARLLFTNDSLLMDDFRNPDIVPGPRGRIYTTRERKDFRPAHKKLLRMKNLCRAPGHG